MIGKFKEILVSNTRLHYDWKGLPGYFKKVSAPSKEGVSIVERDISKADFRKRYNGMRFTAAMSLLTLSISTISLPFALGFSQLLMCLSAIVFFSLIYLRYATILWASRHCWRNWEKRDAKIKLDAFIFLRAVRSEPVEALPLGLPKGFEE